jgi:hypothetical protein
MEPNLIPIETIPPDKSITITVNTDTYIRLQRCLFDGLGVKDYEHFQQCVKEVASGKLEDPMSYHVYTLISLCASIEEAAKKQNITVMSKFDLQSGTMIHE